MNKDLSSLETIMINNLNSMPEREKLKSLEQDIFNNEKCLELIKSFQEAQETYNLFLKIYRPDSQEVKDQQLKLYQAKLELESNPLINNYNQTLITINEPLRYLEYSLFSLFQKRGSFKC